MTEIKTMEQVRTLWKILEEATFPEWQKSDEKRRKEIIEEVGRAEHFVFKEFLKYNEKQHGNIRSSDKRARIKSESQKTRVEN